MSTAASHNADFMKLDSKFFDRLRVKPDQNRLLRDSCSVLRVAGLQRARTLPRAQGTRVTRANITASASTMCGNTTNPIITSPGCPTRKWSSIRRTTRSGIGRPGRSASIPGRAIAVHPTAPGPAASPTASPPTIRSGCSPSAAAKAEAKRERPLKRLERKCLRQLNLEDSATKADIKARFKELVKRLHPDHNQGDRASEDKLREVIQAYNYLRQAGLA